MIKEFEKYKTGKKHVRPVQYLGDTQSITYYQYEFPLGDLINDYIKHIKKPFWRRGVLHDFTTKKYLEVLNIVKISNSY